MSREYLKMCCADSAPNNQDKPARNGPVLDVDRYAEPILTYPMRAVTVFLRNPYARIRVPPIVAYLNTALTGRRQPTAAVPAVVNGSKPTTQPELVVRKPRPCGVALRRVSLVAPNPGEGLLTEPTAGIRRGWRELVFMPLKRPSRSARELA
jgi:hypothetical protein